MSSRAKTVHFRVEEVNMLVDLVIKYKNIVECKVTNGQTWQEKETTWKQITEEFNSSNDRLRTTDTLKNKYEAMKKSIKKKSAKSRQELLKTGGGTIDSPVYDPAEERVRDLILLGVEGLGNNYDEDGVSSSVIQIEEVKEMSMTLENGTVPINVVHLEAIDIIEEEEQQQEQQVLSTPKIKESPQLNWASYSAKHLKSPKNPLLKFSNKRKRSEDNLADTKQEMYKIIKEDIEARRKREEEAHVLHIENMRLEILLKREKLKNLGVQYD